MTAEKLLLREMTMRATLLLALLLLPVATVDAQVPAPRQDRPIALTGGTIHTVTEGVIENGTILFANGVITAIGTDVEVPPGAERVDVSGRHIYPGLVDGNSAMGLYEIGAVDMTVDLSEIGPISPNTRAEVAVNPESRHIGVARSHGVLVTVSSPTGGLVAGQAAAMMLDGWTWEDMTLKRGAGMIVNWPSPNDEEDYSAEIKQLREAFASARAYRNLADSGHPYDSDSRWEALVPVINGDMPVIVDADELRQIQDAITWAEEEGIRIVIRGGRDAPYVADHLARKQIPVMITSVLDSPSREWEPYDSEYSLPAQLHEAGVRFAIVGESSAAYAYRLPHEAGAAVAFGLPEDEALKAITLYPAEFLGFDDRVGSLEVGKDATLLITTGNPLEYSTTFEQAYIEGRKIDMLDQQRRFFEKYMQRLQQTNATTDQQDQQEDP